MLELHSVLIVHDTRRDINALAKILHGEWRIMAAAPDEDVIELAASAQPDLILLNPELRGPDGRDLVSRFVEDTRTRDILLVAILKRKRTSELSFEANAGLAECIQTPWRPELIRARLRNIIELARARAGLHRLVAERVQPVEELHRAMLFAAARLAESREDESTRHVECVRDISCLLAEGLARQEAYRDRISAAFLNDFYHAVALHDLGKLAVPEAILRKPGRLTPEEYEAVQRHTTQGAEALFTVVKAHPDSTFLSLCLDVIWRHHEKWDGTGYPGGLKAEQIPLCAQIVAVADVYDALTGRRCYKEARTHEASVEIIRAGAGFHFAPGVVRVFEALEGEIDEIRRNLAY